MDPIKKLAKKIEEDGIITQEEIEQLDAAITADGKVTRKEKRLLESIVKKFRRAEGKAAELAEKAAKKIERDGVVTREEFDQLHEAIMADGKMTVHEHMIIEQILGKIRMRKLVDGTRTYTKLPCPKCGVGMVEVGFQGINVDRCPRCGGIWFDSDESDKLLALDGSEQLDTRVAFARRDGQPRDLNCPKCHAKMLSVRHPARPLVMAEMCGAKCGMFLDAGEFTDFKQAELAAYLRDAAAEGAES